MIIMTTTTAWDASLHPREATGKFDTKAQSAPELALDSDDSFDLSTFMQEPPAVATPFQVHQPVIYTDATGEERHATIVSTEVDGYVFISERTPGYLFDYDDMDSERVPARYVREDPDIAPGDFRRYTESMAAATDYAARIAVATEAEHDGLSKYSESLKVRDLLKVDGRTNWEATYQNARGRVDRALSQLQRDDFVTADISQWVGMSAYPDVDTPKAFENAADKLHLGGEPVAEAALQAKALTPFAEQVAIEAGDLDTVTDAAEEGFALGRRIKAAVRAAGNVDRTVDELGYDTAEAVFGDHVKGLSQRKGTAYLRAVEKVNAAYDDLERYDLIHPNLDSWGWRSENPDTVAGNLVRAAGQAAILRHYQEETGLTDKQLDAISTVFDGAVESANKAAA